MGKHYLIQLLLYSIAFCTAVIFHENIFHLFFSLIIMENCKYKQKQGD